MSQKPSFVSQPGFVSLVLTPDSAGNQFDQSARCQMVP